MANQPRTTNHKPKSKTSNTYIKYSGLAIQMAVTIGLMGWIGFKIDRWLQLKFPIFLLVLVSLGFVGSLYVLIKSLNN